MDFLFGLRLMRRWPGFSAAAVLVLALAIGVNTALFSVVNALLFTALPVRDPDQLFYVFQHSPEGRTLAPRMSAAQMDLLRSRSGVADYTLHAAATAAMAVGDEVERVEGESVSGNYFSLLGIAPTLGRLLGPEDDNPAAPPAVVISHALWTRRFQADGGVLGRQVRIRDWFVTIVGVAPRGFFGVRDRLTQSDFWMAGAQWAGADWSGAPIGRLERGRSFAAVESRVRTLSPALAELELERLSRATSTIGSQPSAQFAERVRLVTFLARRASDVQMPFEPDVRLIPPGLVAGLVAIVILVLLIAATNVVGLLLARGVTRNTEVAVRRALGADRARLGRQLLAESLVLSAVSGVVGLGLTLLLIALFRANAPARFAIDVTLSPAF